MMFILFLPIHADTLQGDNDKPLASKASYHILQLLQQHPNMKMIVVNEVSALLLRAPLSTSAALHIKKSEATASKEDTNAHARYYAAITFNQILLSSGDADKAVAKKLCDVYFGVFQ